MSTQPEPGDAAAPAPRPAKPRLLQDGRDMFWSLAPLVIACILLAGLAGMCSFQPVGTGTGTVPFYDDSRALRDDAMALGFPVRLPRLPEGWQANSGDRGGITDGRTDATSGQRVRAVTSRVGYLSPAGMHLDLTQSDADEEKLVSALDASMHPTGTVDVDGTTWITYSGDGSDALWTTRLTSPGGPAQLAITGGADAADFRVLAAAVQSQPPLPNTR